MRRRRPVRSGLRSRPDLHDDHRSVHSSVRRSESRRREDRLRRQNGQSRPRRENRVLQTGLRYRMRSVRPGLRSRSGSVRSGSGPVRPGVLMIARSKFNGERRNLYKFGD